MTSLNAIKSVVSQFANAGEIGTFKTALGCVSGMVFSVEVFKLDQSKYSKQIGALATGRYKNGKSFNVWVGV